MTQCTICWKMWFQKKNKDLWSGFAFFSWEGKVVVFFLQSILDFKNTPILPQERIFLKLSLFCGSSLIWNMMDEIWTTFCCCVEGVLSSRQTSERDHIPYVLISDGKYIFSEKNFRFVTVIKQIKCIKCQNQNLYFLIFSKYFFSNELQSPFLPYFDT